MNRSISKKTAVITLLITFVILIGLVWIATLGASPTVSTETQIRGGSKSNDVSKLKYENVGKFNMFVAGNSNVEITAANAIDAATERAAGRWSNAWYEGGLLKYVNQSEITSSGSPNRVTQFNNKNYALRSLGDRGQDVGNIYLNIQHLQKSARTVTKSTLADIKSHISNIENESEVNGWANSSGARVDLNKNFSSYSIEGIETAVMHVRYNGAWNNSNTPGELDVNVLAPNGKIYKFNGATERGNDDRTVYYNSVDNTAAIIDDIQGYSPQDAGESADKASQLSYLNGATHSSTTEMYINVTKMLEENKGYKNGWYYVNMPGVNPTVALAGETSIVANWSITGVAKMAGDYPKTYVNLEFNKGGTRNSSDFVLENTLEWKPGNSDPRILHVIADSDAGPEDYAALITNKLTSAQISSLNVKNNRWDGSSVNTPSGDRPTSQSNIGGTPEDRAKSNLGNFFNSTIEGSIARSPKYSNGYELDILDKTISRTQFDSGKELKFGYKIDMNASALTVVALGIQTEVETPEIDITKSSAIVNPKTDTTISGTSSTSAANQWIGVFPEDTIEYTVTVKNTGGAAVTVDVTDNVPTGTTLVGTPAKGSATSVSVSGGKITWAGVTLAKTTGSATFKFRVKVNKDVLTKNQTTTNTIINDATVIPKGTWTNWLESKTSSKVYNPILSYDKSADKKVIIMGSRITYTLTVVNMSTTHDAKQANYPIVITDNTPKGTQLVTDKGVNPFEAKANTAIEHVINPYTPTTNHANLKWTYTGTLAKNNGSIAYKFQVIVVEDPDEIGTVKNTAYFNGHRDDEDTPIVEIRKSSKPKDGAYVLAGGEITYYLDVKNLSTEYGIEAKAITVTDAIPEKTTYVNGSADNGGTFSEASNKIKWELPGIGKGETLRLSFKVKIDDDATGIIKNHAIMTVGDEDTPTNEVKHHIIDIVKDSDPAPGSTVKEGSDILYKITVTNTSTEDAKGKLIVRDNVPENTTFKEVYDGGATGDKKTIEWTLDGLKAGESATVTFKVTVNYVKEPENTIIKNVAMVVDEDGNETPSNEVEHKLEEVPFDLSLDKMVSKISVTVNGKTTTKEFTTKQLQTIEVTEKDIPNATADIEYTITTKNEGELPGMVKEIVDYLPAGTTFDLNKNPGWGIEGNKVYTTALENTLLKQGETATVKLVLTIKLSNLSDPLLRNIAEISKDWNEVDREDINSTPDNYTADQNPIENDTGIAETLISVRTGLLNSNYIYYLTLGVILLATSVTLQFIAKRAREQE